MSTPTVQKGNPAKWDVVICGGGLAGLTLAKQLKLRQPGINILVLEKERRPLRLAAWKVGESTLGLGAYYLQYVLGLEGYLEEAQLHKFGLRYFFGNSRGPINERPEMGRALYHPGITEWQLDRGLLENDLRFINEQCGVKIIEGVSVEDIHLNREDGHQIVCKHIDTSQCEQFCARWVVDSTGRRRVIQKKLRLAKKRDSSCSASWFRVKGRLDIEDFVPRSDREWHKRIPGNHPDKTDYGRYHSTTHLMGDGYWAWLIPLSSNNTSVGVVFHEDFHSIHELNTLEKALAWIARNEPVLRSHIREDEILDFRTLRGYSYSSERVLSRDRWACTGEGACFQDPFYSPGTNAIAYMNTLTCEAIELDFQGELTEELCEAASREFIEWSEATTDSIQTGYKYFGHEVVFACKLLWDLIVAAQISGPIIRAAFNRGYLTRRHRYRTPEMVAVYRQYERLRSNVFKLLEDWWKSPSSIGTYKWFDYFAHFPYVLNAVIDIFTSEPDPRTTWPRGLKALEELAQAMFLVAAEDTQSQEFRTFSEPSPQVDPYTSTLEKLERMESAAADGMSDRGGVERFRILLRQAFGLHKVETVRRAEEGAQKTGNVAVDHGRGKPASERPEIAMGNSG